MSVNIGSAEGYLDLDITKFANKLKSAKQLASQTADETSSKVNKKLQGIGQGFTAAGTKMTLGLTAPLVAFGTASVAVTANFDSAMSKVSAISGATGKDLDALRQKAKEMGATTKFTATEAAEAFNYMAMAGWKTGEMLDGIEGIMNLAAASGEDLATTSDIVTDALTAMGYAAKDAGRLADVMAAAASNSNTNVAMMGETFKYAAAVAGTLGYSMEDVALSIGLMANAGIKSSQAGTALRSMMSRLAAPTSEVQGAMDKLGISIQNADGSAKPFRDVMIDLREKMSGLSDVEKTQVASAIAGQHAMTGLLAIVNASDKDFNDLASAIDNSEGAAKDMADTMLDNLKGSLVLMKSALEGVSIRFGEVLTPAIKSVVDKLTDFFSKLANASDGTIKLITVLGVLAAAIGPVLLIIGAMATSLLNIINLNEKLNKMLAGKTIVSFAKSAAAKATDTAATIADTIANSTFGKTLGGVGRALGSAASRVLAFASAHKFASIASLGLIGAIAGLVIYMKKTGTSADEMAQKITQFSENLANTINSFAKAFPAMAESFVQSFTDVMNNLVNIIPTLIPALINAGIQLFSSLAESIAESIGPIVEALAQMVEPIVNAIVTLVPVIIQAGITLFKALINAIPIVIPVIVQSIPQIIAAIVNGLLSLVGMMLSAGVALMKALWNGMKSWTLKIANNVVSWAKGLPKKIKSGLGSLVQVGKDWLQGFWNGLKQKWGSVTKWISSKASTIPGMFKKILGIGSPSRISKGFGRWWMEGLQIGMTEKFKPTLSSAREQLNQLLRMYSDAKVPALSVSGANSALTMIGAQGFNFDRFNRTMEDRNQELAGMVSVAVAEAIEGLEMKFDNRTVGRVVRSYR